MAKYIYLEVQQKGNPFNEVLFRQNVTGLSVREQERAWAKIEQRYAPAEHIMVTVKTTEERADRDLGPSAAQHHQDYPAYDTVLRTKQIVAEMNKRN